MGGKTRGKVLPTRLAGLAVLSCWFTASYKSHFSQYFGIFASNKYEKLCHLCCKNFFLVFHDTINLSCLSLPVHARMSTRNGMK